MPAALALEGLEPLDRRARHHRERNALLDVRHLAVPRAEQRRAHRARPLALRAEHVAVDHERLACRRTDRRRTPGRSRPRTRNSFSPRRPAAARGAAPRRARCGGEARSPPASSASRARRYSALSLGKRMPLARASSTAGFRVELAHGMTSLSVDCRCAPVWKTFGQAPIRQDARIVLWRSLRDPYSPPAVVRQDVEHTSPAPTPVPAAASGRAPRPWRPPADRARRSRSPAARACA